jgi:hypothetical protein
VAVRDCGFWLLVPGPECCSRISNHKMFAKSALDIPINFSTNVRRGCEKVLVLQDFLSEFVDDLNLSVCLKSVTSFESQ